MNLDYNSFPALKMIDEKSIGVIKPYDPIDGIFFSQNKASETLINTFEDLVSLPDVETVFQTKRFFLRTEEHKEKFIEGIASLTTKRDYKLSKRFFFGDAIYLLDYEVKKGIENPHIRFLILTKYGNPMISQINNLEDEIGHTWVSNFFVNQIKRPITKYTLPVFVTSYIYHCILVDRFMTKSDMSKRTVRAGTQQHYKKGFLTNSTASDITHIDLK